MLNRKTKITLLKIASMFSVVRGYNIPIIVLAQYLAAIFILSPEKRALSVILDLDLFLIVLASSLSIASGYIINNFYDSQKDIINRPNKSMLDRLVSQKTKLSVYFTLNFIAAFLALIISWRAALFFSAYIFLIWFYSHKIKKYPIIGNLLAALMAILPFFAIMLHYYLKMPFEEIESNGNRLAVIFNHAIFVYLLLLIREMIKDLENIKGDLANGYQTIPIIYGEKLSKRVISLLTISTIIPIYFLIDVYDVGYMDVYFYLCLTILIFFLNYLWKSETKENFLLLHNVLKFLIVAGILSIILINPSVLYHGKNLFLN